MPIVYDDLLIEWKLKKGLKQMVGVAIISDIYI
jgi:hypothetical protein